MKIKDKAWILLPMLLATALVCAQDESMPEGAVLPVDSFIRPARSPAVDYCEGLGFKYVVERTPDGDRGFCKVSDGKVFDAVAFLEGSQGSEFNYCSKLGLKTRFVESSMECGFAFPASCALCVREDGSVEEVKRLMDYNNKATPEAIVRWSVPYLAVGVFAFIALAAAFIIYRRLHRRSKKQ
jgi:putative hemolysin